MCLESHKLIKNENKNKTLDLQFATTEVELLVYDALALKAGEREREELLRAVQANCPRIYACLEGSGNLQTSYKWPSVRSLRISSSTYTNAIPTPTLKLP